MEIRIFSAGKEIGPYSQSQVRQYLSEGLISAADPAYVPGMTEWVPTGQLLARLSPPESAPASNGHTAAHGESIRSVSVRTSALPRTRRGPIEIQPLFVPEEKSVRRARTGKTAITIEAPRPTTQLPPVAKFVPREERRGAKGIVDTGQLAPGHFFDRQAAGPDSNAPTTVPEEDLLTVVEPPPAPEPDIEPVEEIAPEAGEDMDERGVPHTLYAVWYASLVVGLVALALLLAVIYVVWYLDRPASHDTQTSTSPLRASATASTAPRTAADFSAQGFARQQKGDLDGALADYNQAITLDPHNVEALSRRALAERDKGNWDAALADFNTVLAYAPDNADAYSNRGYVRQTKGDLDGALADYTEALSLKPTSAEAFYNVGLIKVRRGDIDGGIEAFNKALDLNPKLARAYYSRGNAKNAEGDVDGAVSDYTQSLEIDPTNAMAYFNRGAARQAKGDGTGALTDYTHALSDDTNLAPAYSGRAGLEVRRGDLNAAMADATRSFELDPNDVSALFSRGLAELGLHTLDRAEADFTKYCETAPRSADCDNARLYLWVIDAEQNLQQKADDALSYALLNTWNSTPEDLTSKIAAFLAGHIREDELITDASAPDPTLEPGRFCRAWYFAGVKRLVSGDTATALAYFQKSLATGQKDCSEYLFAQAQIVSLGQARQASSQAAPSP
jgi:tetratricopeptide (TPR) repeat protein